MIHLSIKHRNLRKILFELTCENNNIKKAVLTAIKQGADLSGADQYGADLYGADLSGADLSGADLSRANLSRANLSEADLSRANLSRANLSRANLSGADLSGAALPNFQIVPSEGSFIAWKKTTKGVIKISIPASAKRTSSLIGRKCRAEYVKVISGPGCGGFSPTKGNSIYNKGEVIYADKFDPDIRTECTNGIHFFMTKEEAEQW